MRKRKKLKETDINKNSAIEIKHSINKIKEQEGKYTIILVVFFMILFSIIGYFTLSFNKERIFDGKSLKSDSNILESSPKVLLTSKNIMTDELGLSSEVYTIEVNNSNSRQVNYQLIFYQDAVSEDECACNNKTFDISNVKYSIDGDTVHNLDSGYGRIIKNGTLEANGEEIINIRMWLDSKLSSISKVGYHLHGHFAVQEK